MQLLDKMREIGLDPGEIIKDGKLHRFGVPGDKPTSKNGWYVFFDDGNIQAGRFGSWKTGENVPWCSKKKTEFTEAEKKAYAAKMAAARQQREAEQQQVYAACREWCKTAWENAQPASPDHPYLVKKRVQPHGIRQFNDVLMVPVMDPGRVVHGIQFIQPDGTKKFKTGTAKSGHFHMIGTPHDNTIVVCEGYATAASVHQATGHCVIVAFDAGNLGAVAKIVRDRRSSCNIILAADDDYATEGNPGMAKAAEAARDVGGLLAIPTFPETRGQKDTDFNDLARLSGLVAVKSCIDNAGPLTGDWPAPIDLIDLSESKPYPPQFIVKDWLPSGYATLFAGHGGVGKSGIALMLAVCIALGLDFFGVPVERRTVLYLSCEDRRDVLHWRLSHICDFLDVSIASLNGWLHLLDLVGHEVILYQPGRNVPTLTKAYHSLRQVISTLCVEVVFVDGISDTYDGNENARAEVKGFINSLLAIIPEDSGAVVLIGHVAKPGTGNKEEGYSGSTGWHNGVRARWYLFPEKRQLEDGGHKDKTGDLIFELQKSNLGVSDLSMRFSWDDDACLFVGRKNCVADLGADASEQEELDGIMAALIDCQDYVPAATTGPRTAFHVLSVLPGFPTSLLDGKPGKKRFWRRVEQLRAMGKIKESFVRRLDGHKTSTLKVCGESAYTDLSHTPDNSRLPYGESAYADRGIYKGDGAQMDHVYTHADFEEVVA